MKTLKYNRQRESIKTCLMNHCDHPTADTLYMSTLEEYPNISLGTVYRNLNLLVELGEVHKLSCGKGADRFDADITPHYHFVCKSYREVLDLPMETLDSMNQAAQEYCDGKINSHITYFHGTCNQCLKTNSKEFNHQVLTIRIRCIKLIPVTITITVSQEHSQK